MNGSNLKVKLEKTLNSVEKTEGVDGTLVVDNQGEILYSNILSNDVSLFGSMANIISNSSEKLLDVAKQGLTERILLESTHGKALFLSLENAHLVVLTHIKANIGMIMIASKRAAQEIKDMEEIKELPVYIEEIPEEIAAETVPIEEIPSEESVTSEISELESSETSTETATIESPVESPSEIPSEAKESPEISAKIKETDVGEISKSPETKTGEEEIIGIPETTEDISTELSEETEVAETISTSAEDSDIEIEKELTAPISETEEITDELTTDSIETETEISTGEPQLNTDKITEAKAEVEVEVEAEAEAEEIVEPPVETTIKAETKEKEIQPSVPEIPVIKPPLSFPALPENVEVPDNLEERSELIIDIYESLLLAMSIGASKIMGMAPARGMLKKSLPYDQCEDLLKGVDVESNSALNFNIIRENLEKIPIENREEKSIDDFTTIITAITENYGRVMGYDAFRGMIRPEFKKIYDSFGKVMESMGIKEKIHPELRELLVS